MQENIIQSVLESRDTLALLPTGGGKSICFQIPAMAREGVCIVISPLIALMRDQVLNLKRKGIKAVAINSSLSKREIDVALDNAVYGDTKFLYMAPERLNSDLVKARLQKMKISLIAIDEAHCISEWGHDFRPAYREIAEVRELLPGVPMIALTATATSRVVNDIVEQLQFEDPAIFRKSFARENLIYVVQSEQNQLSRLVNIIKKLKGSGIVYVSTRKETARQAHLLRANNIGAMPYHGGMDHKERQDAQQLWLDNKAQVVVATSAFGMGIDKADVRYVVHLNLPPSMEAYFQEAGRAGRDGKLAYAIYLHTENDTQNLRERTLSAIPDKDEIKKTYRALINYFQLALGSKMQEPIPFDLKAFSKKYPLHPFKAYNALKALEYCGYLTLSEAIHSPSRLQFLLKNRNLYEFEVRNPQFEKFIQLCLRSYEGLFDQAARIDENNLGARLKKSADEVKKMIRHLEQLRVVRYQEQTELPFISFQTERINAAEVIIDQQYLADRNERIIKKLKSIIRYANNDLVCRSVQLVNYFGESGDVEECGKCDVCLNMRRSLATEQEFEKIRERLHTELHDGPKALTEIETFQVFQNKDVLKVLRWMVDNDLLSIDHEEGYMVRAGKK
jgi:ATP-dependent DNA helicase RecQ